MDYNGEEIDTRILYQFEETGREHGELPASGRKFRILQIRKVIFGRISDALNMHQHYSKLCHFKCFWRICSMNQKSHLSF